MDEFEKQLAQLRLSAKAKPVLGVHGASHLHSSAPGGGAAAGAGGRVWPLRLKFDGARNDRLILEPQTRWVVSSRLQEQR